MRLAVNFVVAILLTPTAIEVTFMHNFKELPISARNLNMDQE
jgi:hypothetical protein